MTRRIAVVGGTANRTNRRLAVEWRSIGLETSLLSGREARALLCPGDVAIGRVDVLATLDGVEPGLLDLLFLDRSGVRVLNPARALLAAHDKLRTARLLEAALLPHPRSGLIRSGREPLPVRPPLVVKPRFGSWGADVNRCDTEQEARVTLGAAARTSWFQRHGALVQEAVPSRGRDLRLVVAGGQVVGAVERTAAPGEWRTNVSLGGTIVPAAPDPVSCRLAVRAARALGCDLVGVDLMPLPGHGYVVLELNGAADFDERYSLPGREVFVDAAAALLLDGARREAAGNPGAARSPGASEMARSS